MTGRDHSIFGSNFTVGLNTQLKLGEQRVRHLKSVSAIQFLVKRWNMTHLVTSEKNVGALQKTGAKQVAQGVIFLVEGENSRRGDT